MGKDERELLVEWYASSEAGKRRVQAALIVPWRHRLRQLALDVLRGRPDTGHLVEDLIHEGVSILLEALPRFDPRLGGSLVAYAAAGIRGRMVDLVSAHSRPVRLPRREQEGRNKVMRFVEAFRLKHGRAPEVDLVAVELGLPRQLVQRAFDAARGHASLDEVVSISGEEIGSRLSMIVDQRPSPEELLLEADRQRHMYSAIEALPERHRQVVEARFGLNGQVRRNLREVAAEQGVTAQRIQQIEVQALKALRLAFKAYGLG